MISNVVILGCGRSGTSIFGELFEALAYRYFFEPSMDQVRQIDFRAGPVAMKVPKASSGSPVTPGLPFCLEDLMSVVPEPRTIFWSVRHPLDAVCSLRPGIEANWSHNPKPADWQAWLERPLIERCARHWSYINFFGYGAVKDIAEVIRYEDLVSAPLQAAERCCSAVGLIVSPERRATIDRWALSVGNRKAPACYEAKHQVVWSRQDHSVRVGRWKENLSPEEVARVWKIVGPAAEPFRYDLPAT